MQSFIQQIQPYILLKKTMSLAKIDRRWNNSSTGINVHASTPASTKTKTRHKKKRRRRTKQKHNLHFTKKKLRISQSHDKINSPCNTWRYLHVLFLYSRVCLCVCLSKWSKHILLWGTFKTYVNTCEIGEIAWNTFQLNDQSGSVCIWFRRSIQFSSRQRGKRMEKSSYSQFQKSCMALGLEWMHENASMSFFFLFLSRSNWFLCLPLNGFGTLSL